MSQEGLTVLEASEKLGVSTRTVRRLIKARKINARLIPGKFGSEYRIFLPGDTKLAEKSVNRNVNINKSAIQTYTLDSDIIRELHEKNVTLAGQLGVASERIRNLENQIRLLTYDRKRWWNRLFRFIHH